MNEFFENNRIIVGSAMLIIAFVGLFYSLRGLGYSIDDSINMILRFMNRRNSFGAPKHKKLIKNLKYLIIGSALIALGLCLLFMIIISIH